MKQAREVYSVTDEQLGRLVGQGTYPGANAAWDTAHKIREAGHTPAVYYSGFSGFTVLNEDVPEELQRSLALSRRAKRFPGV